VFLAVRKVAVRRAKARPPRRLVEHASSAYPSQFFADARTIPLFVFRFLFLGNCRVNFGVGDSGFPVLIRSDEQVTFPRR
jgi:hypothetical protein